MSGIFISYAAEDRERAKLLAHALEERGWPVWWDRMIPLGKSFDTVIEENLARAQCVLVLWTKVSVESRWVRAEASDAAARDVLIPILLEPDVKLPLEFRLLQAADLGDWNGDAQAPPFQALLASIEPMLQKTSAGSDEGANSTRLAPPSPPSAVASGATDARGSRPPPQAKLRPALLFIFLPTLLAGAATLTLMSWRLPTRVQLDLVVARMSFRLAGRQAVDLPAQPLDFRMLSIENYDRVRFTPQRWALGTHEDSFHTESAGSGEMVLAGTDSATPVLTMARADAQAQAAGRLESLALRPGSEVILDAGRSSGPGLTLRVDGEDLSTHVLPRGMLELSATATSIVGDSRATSSSPLLMRVTLPPHAPYFTIEGTRRPFVVSATLNSAAPISLGTDIRIDKVEFLKQGPGGAPETAVAAPGQIAYPEYPDVAAVALRSTDLVGLKDLEGISLSRLTLAPERGGLELRLEGVAGAIDTVSAGTRQDHRLSLFDRLWHGTRVTIVSAVLAWMLSVSVGAYRLFRVVATQR